MKSRNPIIIYLKVEVIPPGLGTDRARGHKQVTWAGSPDPYIIDHFCTSIFLSVSIFRLLTDQGKPKLGAQIGQFSMWEQTTN